MKTQLLLLFTVLALVSCKENKSETVEKETTELSSKVTENDAESAFNITPISHATMVLEWDGKTIYVDPVGGEEAFIGQYAPDFILVTDIHGDHFSGETINAISGDSVKIMVPQAVADKMEAPLLNRTIVLENGETTTVPGLKGFSFEAIPMYNLREEAKNFHTKGRGNGYVIEKSGRRLYISGDTEDIPEMRNLKDIDVAFVCMNLPYTMTVESAADAVIAFKPNKVFPYHYRGTDGLSDVNKFKQLIENSAAADEIDVVQLNWYPQR